MALQTISLLFTVVAVAWIAAGMALTLWGLKLFKAFIMTLGGVIGFGIGVVAGLIMGGTAEGIILGVILAVVGACIAWPLQKLLVFIGVGGICALIAMSLVLVSTSSLQSAFLVGVIAFIVGGAVALLLYEYFIVIVFAASGADMVFQLAAPTPLNNILAGMIRGEKMTSLLSAIAAQPSRFISAYAHHFSAYAVLLAVFICFALYFQKRNAYDKNDVAVVRRKKFYVKRAAYLYGLLALASVAGTYSIDAGASFGPVTGFSQHVGVAVVSWPVLSVAAARLLHLLSQKYEVASDKPVILGVIALFSLTVTPTLNSIVLDIWHHLVIGRQGIPSAVLQHIVGYYQGFIPAAPALTALKIAFAAGSTALLWCILSKGIEHYGAEQPAEHLPPRFPYREETRGEDLPSEEPAEQESMENIETGEDDGDTDDFSLQIQE